MKGPLVIQKGGFKLHPDLTKQFIEQILRDKGCKFSEHQNYELWAYPGDNPKFWYILKGDTRKEVVREIKPTYINEYVNNSVERLQEILISKEKKMQQLQTEILKLKTKKRVKEFESEQRDLNQFIQRREEVSW